MMKRPCLDCGKLFETEGLSSRQSHDRGGRCVQEQNRGLARYVLEPWTTRIQERLTRLLTGGKKAEFDYTAFVQPDPETEISLLIDQVDAGLLTINEARNIRNLPPLPGGDAISDDAGNTDDETDSKSTDSGVGVLQRFGQPLILPTPVANGADHG